MSSWDDDDAAVRAVAMMMIAIGLGMVTIILSCVALALNGEL